MRCAASRATNVVALRELPYKCHTLAIYGINHALASWQISEIRNLFTGNHLLLTFTGSYETFVQLFQFTPDFVFSVVPEQAKGV